MSKKTKAKLKVNLVASQHSAGRGVGFYADNLAKSLSKLKGITLTSQNPDIIHYPFFDLFYPSLDWYKPKPTLVTIHDLTPLVLKDKYPKGIRGSLNLLRQRLSLINIRAIITDSRFSATDINKLFFIPQNKIFVVYPSHDPIFYKKLNHKKLKSIKAKYNLPNRFILNVSGGPNPNKNLVALAQATRNLNIPLVIVGKEMLQKINYPVHKELQDLASLKKFDHIIYPGFIPTTDLLGFYQLASLYCQSSLYEGFGIPILEAQAAGCLLVSSNSSSLPELYASNTLNFNPNHLLDITKALHKGLFLSKLQKNKLIQEGKLKAQEFSWAKTAQNMYKVYQTVAQA